MTEQPPEKQHFFDKPSNVKRVLRIFYGVCVALFVADFAFHRHAERALEGYWGFYAIYGFVACVVLVLMAKEMRKVLLRDEQYYDAKDCPTRQPDDRGDG